MSSARTKKRGSLEIIAGCMFSGKTEELMRLVRRAEYAKQKIVTIKHSIDNRVDVRCINSHAGRILTAHAAKDLETLRAGIASDTSVIAIDEAQFFPRHLIDFVEEQISNGKRVIAAGLDTDFRGMPFGVMPELLSLADHVTKLTAICVKCCSEARHTQRLVNGRPAKWDDPLVQVGAEDAYEARCRDCFEIERPVTVFYGETAPQVQV
jgi:thymidine kinase